jgi:ubiquinone/menaquinone biosynthesis C-methylase UbiE
MDVRTIEQEKAELERRYGPWTAHNIRLADRLYTISPEPAGDEVKLRRVTQIVCDILGGEVGGARILDLACLEGMYALEFASRGARVVGIEGREANLAKAEFAARVLDLDVDFRLGDVRHLSRNEHGEFDVVLCLGILYHLDADDLFTLVNRIGDTCRRALVVDTHAAAGAKEQHEHDGFVYEGHRLVEHDPEASDEERLAAVWSSLDNLTAFALTRASLESLLARTGFTSVYECHVPAEPAKERDRITLLALKGNPAGDLISPEPHEDPTAVPSRPPLGRLLEGGSAWRTAGRLLPRGARRRLRALLGAETRKH